MRIWLKEAREKAKLSQTDVAELVEITQQFYNYIENDERRPSVQVAKKIAKILSFDWQLFYPDEENSA